MLLAVGAGDGRQTAQAFGRLIVVVFKLAELTQALHSRPRSFTPNRRQPVCLSRLRPSAWLIGHGGAAAHGIILPRYRVIVILPVAPNQRLNGAARSATKGVVLIQDGGGQDAVLDMAYCDSAGLYGCLDALAIGVVTEITGSLSLPTLLLKESRVDKPISGRQPRPDIAHASRAADSLS